MLIYQLLICQPNVKYYEKRVNAHFPITLWSCFRTG